MEESGNARKESLCYKLTHALSIVKLATCRGDVIIFVSLFPYICQAIVTPNNIGVAITSYDFLFFFLL